MMTVPDALEGAITTPLNELPPFNVRPPLATFNVSHSGLLADPIEAFTVIPLPTVSTTGPTTRSSLWPFNVSAARL